MATVNDAKFAALAAYPGAMPDKTLAWLQANGATSSSVNDAWRQFLDIVVVAPTGHRNDDWYTYLGSLGHTGSLNDREYAFWVGQIPPAFFTVVESSGSAGQAAIIRADSDIPAGTTITPRFNVQDNGDSDVYQFTLVAAADIPRDDVTTQLAALIDPSPLFIAQVPANPQLLLITTLPSLTFTVSVSVNV